MRWLRSRSRTLGFTLVEVMAVTGIMSALHSQGGYQYAITKANEARGIHNLKQIYMLLEAQCIGGALPNAAFYPAGDPMRDPKSIVRLIEGASPDLFVSPFAPEGLKRRGLTFAWNDTVNGKDLSLLPRDTWLLIDLAAFIADPSVPKPGRYLVLYADGRALAVSDLPQDIVEIVRQVEAKKTSSRPASQ